MRSLPRSAFAEWGFFGEPYQQCTRLLRFMDYVFWYSVDDRSIDSGCPGYPGCDFVAWILGDDGLDEVFPVLAGPQEPCLLCDVPF
jgi:hypothetical protein